MSDNTALYFSNLEALRPFISEQYYNYLSENTVGEALVEYQDDGHNIKVNGLYIYETSAERFSNAHVNAFLANLDSSNRAERKIQLQSDISGASMSLAHKGVYDFVQEHKEDIYFNNNNSNIFDGFFGRYGVIVGIGAGCHIPLLIERTPIKHWIISDLYIDMLQASLYIIDWVNIVNIVNERKGSIKILCVDNPPLLGRGISEYCSSKFLGISDGALYYRHYNYDNISQVSATLLENMHNLFLTSGWYEDDIIHMKHTIDNVNHYNKNDPNRRVFISNDVMDITMPAMIIGRGPSLYHEAYYLKLIRNQFVVISCGSSLRSLLEMGITPDIHVEQENSDLVENLLKDIAADYDISDIILVHTSTAAPKSAYLFKRSILLGREAGLFLEVILTPIPQVRSMSRTCTLTGTLFAYMAGFKTIHLLGIDLSYGGYGNRQASYKPPQKMIDNYLLPFTGPIQEEAKLYSDVHIKGNFTPIVKSNEIWQFMHEGFVGHQQNFAEHTIFNHSNGVYIAGTKPLPISNVAMSPTPEEKSRDVAAKIFNNYKISDNLLGIPNFHGCIASSVGIAAKFLSKTMDELYENHTWEHSYFISLADAIETTKSQDDDDDIFISAMHGFLAVALYKMIEAMVGVEKYLHDIDQRKLLARDMIAHIKRVLYYGVAELACSCYHRKEDYDIIYDTICDDDKPLYGYIFNIVTMLYPHTDNKPMNDYVTGIDLAQFITYPRDLVQDVIHNELLRISFHHRVMHYHVKQSYHVDHNIKEMLPLLHKIAEQYIAIYEPDHYCHICSSHNVRGVFKYYMISKHIRPIVLLCDDCGAETSLAIEKNYSIITPYDGDYNVQYSSIFAHLQDETWQFLQERHACITGDDGYKIYIGDNIPSSLYDIMPNNLDIMLLGQCNRDVVVDNVPYKIVHNDAPIIYDKVPNIVHIQHVLLYYGDHQKILHNIIQNLPKNTCISMVIASTHHDVVFGDILPQDTPYRLDLRYMKYDKFPIHHSLDSVKFLWESVGINVNICDYKVVNNSNFYIYIEGVL